MISKEMLERKRKLLIAKRNSPKIPLMLVLYYQAQIDLLVELIHEYKDEHS